jgi:serine/threonine-protein kinase
MSGEAEHQQSYRLQGTPYILKKRLGVGGMGAVYLAEHAELGREFAIKLLAPHARDQISLERLKREARAAAAIGNPHIIDVYDLGESADGRTYVVMQLVRGKSLHGLIEGEGAQPVERVLDLVDQVAGALQAAHEIGVIHRDLKPENVMVEARDGRDFVIVLDFGIAQRVEESDADTRLTRDGRVVGTPGYMSPEQATGRPVDGRSDQYSLAVLTYELLAGSSPFSGMTSPLEIIAAQLTTQPKPLCEYEACADLAPGIQAAIDRAMTRDPEARYESVIAFAAALREANRAVAAGAPTVEQSVMVPEPSPPRTGVWIAAAFAASVAAAFFAVSFFRGEAEPPERPVATAAAPAPVAPASAPAAPTAASVDAAAIETTPDAAAPVPDASARPPVVAAARPKLVAPAARRPQPSATAKPQPAAAKPKPAVAAPSGAPTVPRPQAAPEPESPEPVDAPAPAPAEPTPEPEPAPAVKPATPVAAAPSRPTPKPAAPPKLVIADATVDGGASTRKIRSRMRDAHGDIRACVGGLSGLTAGDRATVSLLIDSDGFFTDVRGNGNSGLARCGTRAVKSLNRLKRRPDTGDITVRLSLRMEADG